MSEPFLGEIRMFAGNFAPQGWAFCAGQLLDIASNQALFSLLGTTYGGNGTVSFGLPDLRGRSPVGMGAGPGLTPVKQGVLVGQESVNLSVDQLPDRSLAVTVSVAIPASAAGVDMIAKPTDSTVLGSIAAGGRPGTLYSKDVADVTLRPFSATGNTASLGSGAPVSLRNPNIGTNFIIALEGLFPSRN
ncbi:phage tail protein [Shewanella sp. HL-SH8]|uniref:phage tail protein n=1 Tax=Shewanella sp. HL-SH8 TaxID=3436242 RepID=UPI003EBEC554